MTDEITRRRFVVATGATAGALTLAGCGSGGGSDGSDGSDGGDGGSGSTTVEMTDELVYSPGSLEIEVGTTVVWENTGSIGHTVTAYGDEIPDGATYFASGGFDSQDAAVSGYENGQEGNIPEGETYEHTFQTAGEYEYYCIPHEMNGMVGTVSVVE